MSELNKKHISIDPITRLEGHGNISIFLNDAGEVENAYPLYVNMSMRGMI